MSDSKAIELGMIVPPLVSGIAPHIPALLQHLIDRFEPFHDLEP